MKRTLTALLAVFVACAASAGCGADAPPLTFDFVLTNCVAEGYAGGPVIAGIIILSNSGTASIRYGLPCRWGYEALDATGGIVSHADAWDGNFTGTPCGNVDVPAGGQAYAFVSDSNWNLEDQNGAPVPLGVYSLSINLLHGDHTTPATVTVCDGNPPATGWRYPVCNSPCADEALAQREGVTLNCGAALTCGP